jgi:hypothetical protein
MNNNEIFLNFWKNFEWPEAEELYFRLYYDDHGRPLCYSRHALEGKFIDVTAEQFALGDMNVEIVNGVLIHQSPPPPPKLKPSKQGQGVWCHKHDVTVVVDKSNDARQWNLE